MQRYLEQMQMGLKKRIDNIKSIEADLVQGKTKTPYVYT
jgi:hypothetical protein